MGLYPQAEGELKGALAAYLATIPDSEAKSDGIRLGEAVAAKVLEARANDGADAPDAYRPKTKPGVYVPTPITVASTWPNVKPFAHDERIAIPAGAADRAQERAVGHRLQRNQGPRRQDQHRAFRATDRGRPLLAHHRSAVHRPVVRQLVAAKKMSLIDSARFMALTAVALADAYIAVLDAKYHYDFWRPITAIRNGDIDDNPATERDATWQPIDNTPMHPEYPCAHCIGSARSGRGGGGRVRHGRHPGSRHDQPDRAGRHASVDQSARPMPTRSRKPASGPASTTGSRPASGQDMGRKIGDYVVKNVMQPASVPTR